MVSAHAGVFAVILFAIRAVIFYADDGPYLTFVLVCAASVVIPTLICKYMESAGSSADAPKQTDIEELERVNALKRERAADILEMLKQVEEHPKAGVRRSARLAEKN
jgi:membrane protein implicated in regulation of membrane protease activity